MILGLGCGEPHGSAEILLKAALEAAQAGGAEVALVRLNELSLPTGGESPSRTTRRGCGSASSPATG